jgi:outer membrane protein assembly factor BamB
VAVSLRDGRVKWITQLPAFEDPDDRDGPIRWSGPVLINERLLLVSSEGEAVFLSPYDGERLGGFELPDPVYITPVVANERVYFLTDDARLIAYQ